MRRVLRRRALGRVRPIVTRPTVDAINRLAPPYAIARRRPLHADLAAHAQTEVDAESVAERLQIGQVLHIRVKDSASAATDTLAALVGGRLLEHLAHQKVAW